MTSLWSRWCDATVPAGTSIKALAARTGVDERTATLCRETPSADWVVTLARAYAANPLEGLLAAGLVDAEDVRRFGVASVLAQVSYRELLAEAHKRVSEWDAPQQARRLVDAGSLHFVTDVELLTEAHRRVVAREAREAATVHDT